MAGEWRYFATRYTGNGIEKVIAPELPLEAVSISRKLSGPGELSGSISVEVPSLFDERGEPILQVWRTALYAELDGVIRGAGILTSADAEGSKLSLETSGWTSYLAGIPYAWDTSFIDADVFDICRHIWSHVQGFANDTAGGNLGVTLDQHKSGRLIGTKPDPKLAKTEADPEGPYRLQWFATHDLGQVWDDLASYAPFDFQERHWWEGETIRHHIDLGYTKLGRRRTDLRFAVGENVKVVPTLEADGERYASEVYVLGSGEGRKMIRGLWRDQSNGIRRPKVITDKRINKHDWAMNLARFEWHTYQGPEDIKSVTVKEHPNASIGSINLGDEIRIIGDGTGWAGAIDTWLRVLEVSEDPGRSGEATLTVTRADRHRLDASPSALTYSP